MVHLLKVSFVSKNQICIYIPDLDTVIPWTVDRKSCTTICDVFKTDGTPFEGDPRANLKRVLRRMEDMGFTDFNLGSEPEFFLFKLDRRTYIRIKR